MDRLKTYLLEPIHGYYLGIFRLLFGIIMSLEMIDYLRIDLVKNMFVLPAVNFKYDGLHWLQPLPELWMNALIVLLLLFAVFITFGIWFTWATRLFALGYLYIFLLDTSLYNNHIYLFILLALLLSFTHADQFISLSKNQVSLIGRWEVFILQLQIIIVYFFAGIAKLNYDWMFRRQPVTILVDQFYEGRTWLSLQWREVFINILNYGGMAIDLMTPLLLWYKPIRKWSFFLFFLFHLGNHFLFDDIGLFPFLMMAGLILFFDPVENDWMAKLSDRFGFKKKSTMAIQDFKPSLVAIIFLLFYFLFQLLFPLRGYFLTNDMDYSSIGNRFAWRVKMDHRKINILKFKVIYSGGQEKNIDLGALLNTHQIITLVRDPRSCRDLAKCIKSIEEKNGLKVKSVLAEIKIEVNGRLSQYFLDPMSNLLDFTYSPFNKLNELNHN